MKQFVLVVLVVGCGSDSKTDLDGIYSVDTWTSNAACDMEGMSIKDQNEPVFFVKYEVFPPDYAALNVRTCADLAECQASYADDGTLHVGLFSFERGNAADGWTDQRARVSALNGPCTGAIVDDRLTRRSPDGVRIERRRTEVTPFAPDAANECTTAAALAAAEGKPCTSLEVVTGLLVES